MQQQVLTELEQLLGLFQQVLGLRAVDDLSELVKSERIYLDILAKLIPDFQDFYQEVQEDQESSLEEKLSAIVNFIEEEVVEQKLDVDPVRIANGDYAEAAQLLDILYELLEGLMEDQRQRKAEEEKKQKKKQKSKEEKPPVEKQVPPALSNKKGKQLQLNIPSSRESQADPLDSKYRGKDSGELKKQKENLINQSNDSSKVGKARPASSKPSSKPCKNDPMQEEPMNSGQITSEIVNQISKARQSAANKHKVEYKFADPSSDQVIEQAKSVYKRYLTDKLHSRKQKNLPSADLVRKNLKHSLQKIQKEGQHLSDQLKEEQLRCFIELRDEKLRYVQRIHKLVLQLEKEKYLDEQNQQKKAHEQQLRITKIKMESLESAYSNNMQLLKEASQKTRAEQNRTRVDQKAVMVDLQKQLKHDRHQQMQGMFESWEKQKMRLRGLFRQNTQLQEKLVRLYKRN